MASHGSADLGAGDPRVGPGAAAAGREPQGRVPRRASSTRPTPGATSRRRVFWGDTHLHTSASMDAGAFGNRLGLEDAYRFARGEELTASAGAAVKLSRPLDFLVIADHSDNMGFFPALFAGKPEMLADPTGKRWYDMVQAGGEDGVKAALEIIDTFSRGTFPKALQFLPGSDGLPLAWDKIIEAAEKYNEPGRFTAFIGYEWTSQVPPGNNLHRVVIYRDGGDKASQTEPFTTYPPLGSTTPEDLWKVLQAYEDKTGGRVLAIAAQRQSLQRLDVPGRDQPGDRQPLIARVRRDARPLGAALRGDADQGRRRGAPVLSPERRDRRLRALGQGQPQPERGEEAGDAAGRVRPQRAPDRPPARAEARRQPLQVRHDRLDRQPHLARDRRGGQLLRQALRRRAQPAPRRRTSSCAVGDPTFLMGWQQVASGLRRRLGAARTRARRSGTR